eukprot:Selendium_serpulae@DN5823_c1_g1_i4.p1
MSTRDASNVPKFALLSMFSISDYICKPCPRVTLRSTGVCLDSRYRPEVKESGGQLMFPYLVDYNFTNTVKINDSGTIVEHLWKHYGGHATPPLAYRLYMSRWYQSFQKPIMALLRPSTHMGVLRAQSRAPSKNLHLWGHEGSPFVKRVRELLTTLELPYVMHSMSWGSVNRKPFREAHKKQLSSTRNRLSMCKIPLLKDPNTDVEIFDSISIVRYLQDTYQEGHVCFNESWLFFNTECPSARSERMKEGDTGTAATSARLTD